MKATENSKRNFIFCISLYDLLRQQALPILLFCQGLNIFKAGVNVSKYIHAIVRKLHSTGHRYQWNGICRVSNHTTVDVNQFRHKTCITVTS